MPVFWVMPAVAPGSFGGAVGDVHLAAEGRVRDRRAVAQRVVPVRAGDDVAETVAVDVTDRGDRARLHDLRRGDREAARGAGHEVVPGPAVVGPGLEAVDDQVGPLVAVDVARGEVDRATGVAARLDRGLERVPAADGGAGRADAALVDVDRAGGVADGQVVRAVAVEVAGGEVLAPVVVRGDGRVGDGDALAGQAARGAPQHGESAAVGVAADLLSRGGHGEVVVSVAVEVGVRGLRAEGVTGLRGAGDPGAVLAERGPLGGGHSGGGAVEGDELAGGRAAVHIGARGREGHVADTVAVEVGVRHGRRVGGRCRHRREGEQTPRQRGNGGRREGESQMLVHAGFSCCMRGRLAGARSQWGAYRSHLPGVFLGFTGGWRSEDPRGGGRVVRGAEVFSNDLRGRGCLLVFRGAGNCATSHIRPAAS